MKESSDSEPRRGAGESHKKNWAPRSIVFSSRFARARVSLNCKRALPCSGRRCVCAKVSLVSAGAPRHGPALPAWRLTPGLFCVVHCLCVWRALGQSAQAEQDTLILCSKQESVEYIYCSVQMIMLLFLVHEPIFECGSAWGIPLRAPAVQLSSGPTPASRGGDGPSKCPTAHHNSFWGLIDRPPGGSPI